MKTAALYHSLEKAKAKFAEALLFEDSEPLRESLIQRFEYTFELSWKLMRSILNDEGIPEVGVRSIIRKAATLGVLTDPVSWLKFAHARNMTSHLYNEQTAFEVANIARNGFIESVGELLEAVRERWLED